MFSDVKLKYFKTGHRVCEPSKTLKKNEDKLIKAGITRITDITDLDRVGIPVFSAIRPTAQSGAVSVYAGKGAEKDQAEASAMMEAFERYSAEMKETDKEKIIVSSIEDMKGEKFIDPKSLYLPNNITEDILQVTTLEWYPCIDIVSEEEYYVPANAIFHPYIPANKSATALFKGNTNGLASGNVIEEAVLHGIFEVVERDAWSIFELVHKNKRQIDNDSITNPIIRSMLNKFNSQNINIKLMDITSDTGIPTVTASSDDDTLKDPALLCLGVGTHLDPDIAIIRALTEVAQSRATQIHGTREDTTRANFMRKAGYERMKKINHMYYEDEKNKISREDMNDLSGNSSLKEDIEVCKDNLIKCGLDKILYTDLTRPEIDISACRVVIPGAELYTIDPTRLGIRYENFL
jgi:ribosomal protein S12 methylthiotransferase accessory factor